MNLDDQKTVAILALPFQLNALDQESWQRVADRLAQRLEQPVLLHSFYDLESAAESLENTIAWYASQSFTRMVFLGVSFGPMDWSPIYSALTWSTSNTISVYLSKPWQIQDWADAFAPPAFDAFATDPFDISVPRHDNLILLLASGNDSQTDRRDDLPLLAHQMMQYSDSAVVRYSFTSNVRPFFSDILEQLNSTKKTNLLLLPWRLSCQEFEQCCTRAGMQLDAQEEAPKIGKWFQNPGVLTNSATAESKLNTTLEIGTGDDSKSFTCRIKLHPSRSVRTLDLLSHVGIVHVLVDKYLEALSKRPIRVTTLDSNPNDAMTRTAVTLQQMSELQSRIDAMLPSEYQGRTEEVSPKSMGSASLAFDEHGRVAWDKIWTSFCDLALAGGPPHRGKLLEAVGREDVERDRQAYDSVAQEIRRGIELVTGLSTQESSTLGWIGVVCDSEAMAVWLLRAIIVENVMVRREDSVLFLPAGPRFTVKREIKNVITSVAKTVHYWRSHLRHKGTQLT